MIVVELTKPNTIEFDMSIHGMAEMPAPEVFFCVHASVAKLSFQCNWESVHNKWYVTIPKLVGALSPGLYPCQIEVLIGDRFFIPLKDQITFEQEEVPVVTVAAPQVVPEPQPVEDEEPSYAEVEEPKVEVPVKEEVAPTSLFKILDIESKPKKPVLRKAGIYEEEINKQDIFVATPQQVEVVSTKPKLIKKEIV
jgi:hypothetical protein